MIRKKDIKEGAVFSIKLKENLYTLAQIRFNHRLECFDIKSNEDNWVNIDLNKIPLLFCIVVAEDRLSKLFCSVQTGNVVPNKRPIPKEVISFAGRKTPALIIMDDSYESWCGKVLIEHLTIKDHLDIIYNTEDASMEGDPKKIAERLNTYFATGVNWEPSKKFIFPGIEPPKPKVLL